MKDFLKKTGWTDVIVSVIFALIGIFMIIKPDSATKIISYIIGGLFIVIGIIKIINYYIAKGNYDFYNYDLLYGIIAIGIGLISITCSGLIESLFRIMIGAWIIYSGFLRLSLSIKLHRVEVNIWSLSLILSILMIIGGLYMLLESGALILTIGVIMVIYSISDLVESIIFVKNVNELL